MIYIIEKSNDKYSVISHDKLSIELLSEYELEIPKDLCAYYISKNIWSDLSIGKNIIFFNEERLFDTRQDYIALKLFRLVREYKRSIIRNSKIDSIIL